MDSLSNQQQKWLAYGLVGAGVLFLLNNIFGLGFGASFWPFFVIAPGAFFLYIAYSDGQDKAGFIFPGVVITGTGLILLYQSMTNHWTSWAYIWTLYPVFVGLGLRFYGERTGHLKQIENGRQMVNYGLIAFVIGFAFFELLIFGGGGNLAWVLIAAGAAMWIFSNRRTGEEYDEEPSNGRKPKVKNDEEFPVV